jgi:hypothetical protein
METKRLQWKHGLPTEVGWYWFRNTKRKYESAGPDVVYVRDYVGILSVGNCGIKGCTFFESGEWAGPILLPE